MWSLLLGAALAGPIFTSVEEEIALPGDGNWPRLFPAGGGRWHFLHANAGDYNYVLLDDRFERVPDTDRPLTGETTLRDHSVAPCPDGTFLDAATAETEEPNDTLYVFRLDSNFNVLDRALIYEDADATTVLADVPAICGSSFRGVAWLKPWDSISTEYAALDDDLRVTGLHRLWRSPQAMGSTLIEEDGELRVIGFPTPDLEPNLILAAYDATMQPVHHVETDIAPEGWTPYWAQASMRVGDLYIVAHMAQDDRYEWGTLGGDLWVSAMDPDWNLVDQVKLTSNVAPDGGMQPGMARSGSELLVTYSKDLHNYLYVVGMDLAAAGEIDPEEPGGADDTGATADSEPEPDEPEGPEGIEPVSPSSCGCAVGTPSASLLRILAALALAGRRRS